jgi:glycosyltransferase involved in cell wall biosynthesis
VPWFRGGGRVQRGALNGALVTPTERRLSAIIITRNEGANLPDCLASLSFCDEIVVVDNASTDGTAALAAKAGARVIDKADFPGFGAQKQAALDQATGDWVLSIDADERVPEPLAREIQAAIATGTHAGYRIKRRTFFLGRYLRHGGWYPDRVLRLARRADARFSADAVHERLDVSGSVGDLDADMLHMSYRTVDDVLAKQRRYAMLSAQARRERGVQGGLFVALLRAKFTFLKCYLLQAGFLDGSRGLVAAIARAQESFWRYLAVGWERP